MSELNVSDSFSSPVSPLHLPVQMPEDADMKEAKVVLKKLTAEDIGKLQEKLRIDKKLQDRRSRRASEYIAVALKLPFKVKSNIELK
jgi:hypothetical protein